MNNRKYSLHIIEAFMYSIMYFALLIVVLKLTTVLVLLLNRIFGISFGNNVIFTFVLSINVCICLKILNKAKNFNLLLSSLNSKKIKWLMASVLLSIGTVIVHRELFKVFLNLSGNQARLNYSSITLIPLLVLVIRSLVEELFFRTAIFAGLAERYKMLLSIIISSSIYALFTLSINKFIFYLPMAIICAYIYAKTRSLLLIVITHVLYKGFFSIALLLNIKIKGLTIVSNTTDYCPAFILVISILAIISSLVMTIKDDFVFSNIDNENSDLSMY